MPHVERSPTPILVLERRPVPMSSEPAAGRTAPFSAPVLSSHCVAMRGVCSRTCTHLYIHPHRERVVDLSESSADVICLPRLRCQLFPGVSPHLVAVRARTCTGSPSGSERVGCLACALCSGSRRLSYYPLAGACRPSSPPCCSAARWFSAAPPIVQRVQLAATVNCDVCTCASY